MKDKEIEIAISQVNSIIEHMSISIVQRIPEKFRNFLKENSKEEYYIDIKSGNPLTKQNISPKAVSLLAVIYRNYWCEDKKAYDELLQRNQEKYNEQLREKYAIKFNLN